MAVKSKDVEKFLSQSTGNLTEIASEYVVGNASVSNSSLQDSK